MTNRAAWLQEKQQVPLKIDDAPMWEPEGDEVLIRNHAVAINPVDWAVQALGIIATKYPHILGCDVAGEVIAVGLDVKNFKKGDRVVAGASGSETNSKSGAFQLYCCVTSKLVSKLPDNVSYTDAAVLPLGLSTAAVSLFQKDTLALPHPQINPKPNGKVILVWGGGSSVGSNGVQLAKAAGFEVAATASAHNFDYLKGLGADYVFDARKEDVVDDIVTTLKGKEFGGAFAAISEPDTIRKCAQIASKLGGNKFVATVLPGPPTMAVPEGLPADVKTSYCWGSSLKHNEVGDAIYGKWVTAALANGQLKCKPDPLVVGQGLGKIQDALAKWREGVSARKVVVELP
ncbi:zinc-binding oxidoreductase CipB [Lepidopterella palustris CBS 459.81]|uniref:Zinc-binding oxidoreductase CipB n=1 Tax=Lepidopterella palustris CBS 459.81 TaxID=1314670 RepID=A0A8E2E4P3_9PEZI|nr:zinc-binding oxidoreductase CipB [Lepidopterella palustris CBS 459.81]